MKLKKKKALSLGEALEIIQEGRIELLGILRMQMGICRRIAEDKDRWSAGTRMLARTLVPQIQSEIHELKIEVENERLGELPF